jgi:acetylornithine deacetylase/succinyl-diaminopimelate desuccinylase-like protein
VESWTHDPFLGDIVHDDETGDDHIFGRGAIDDKQARRPDRGVNVMITNFGV